MERFRKLFFMFIVFQQAGAAEKRVDIVSRLTLDQMALGRLNGVSLYYETLTKARKQIEIPIISSEFRTMCLSSICEASWSPAASGAWIVVRNLRSDEIMVLSDLGQVIWKQKLAFEVRSMLSVSGDGTTVAVVGRREGVEHIWHIDSKGALPVWKVVLKENSGRLLVGWLDSGTKNVFADGEWIVECDRSSGGGCRRLVRGYFPSISPDKKFVAFLLDEKTVGVFDIALGGVVARLFTRFDWSHETPKWTPDSTRVVLNEGTGRGSKLVIVDFGGKRTRYSRVTDNKSTTQVGIVLLPTRH